MIATSALLPRILPYVPGCPEPAVLRALVDSAIDFCDTSMAVRRTLTTISTAIGVSTYPLAPTAFEEVSRLISVRIGSAYLAVAASDTAAFLTPGSNSQPKVYFTTSPQSILTLNLYPAPDAAYTVTVEAAMRPLRSTAQLQDDLHNIWGEAVLNGAFARVMAMPNQPYSDYPGARDYKLRATSMARRARTESSIGRVQASQSVRMNPFA